MAKRGKKIGKSNYEFKYREDFAQLLKKKNIETKTIAGFKTKNINQNWRWDDLSDVKV